MLTGVTVAVIVRGNAAVCVSGGLLESVTLKVTDLLVTACVGIPVMAPVDGFRVSPAGSVPPLTLQL